MDRNTEIEQYWQEFLKAEGLDKSLRYKECFHFDLTEANANALLELVLQGQKKATASSLHYFEGIGEPLPEEGDYSIVTDWTGTPKCVIRTTQVTVRPFREITWEMAKREGEDESLESWQRSHVKFFTAEGKAEGYVFSEEMPVVFEDFEVAWQ